MPSLLLAQTEDATTMPNTASDAVAAAAGTGLLAVWGGLMIFWLILVLVSVIFFIWWIVLLIDLTKREWPQKTTYLIIMIIGLFIPFGLLIVDLIYYFGVVKKGVGSKSGGAPATPAA